MRVLSPLSVDFVCPVLQLKKDSRSSDESVSDNDDLSNGFDKSRTGVAPDGKGLKGLERNGLSAHRMSRK